MSEEETITTENPTNTTEDIVTVNNDGALEWKFDQLVWAKVAGHPFWPAIIFDPSKAPGNVLETAHTKNSRLVRFFGDGSFGWLNEVADFRNNFDQNSKTRSKSFKIALAEAEEYEKTGIFPMPDIEKTESTEYEYPEDNESEEEVVKPVKKRKKKVSSESTPKKRKPRKNEYEDLGDEEEIAPKSRKTSKRKSTKKTEFRKEIYELVRGVTKKYKSKEFDEALTILKKVDPFTLVQDPETGREEKSKYTKLSSEDIKMVKLGKLIHVLSKCEDNDLSAYASKLFDYYSAIVKKDLKETKLLKATPILKSLKASNEV